MPKTRTFLKWAFVPTVGLLATVFLLLANRLVYSFGEEPLILMAIQYFESEIPSEEKRLMAQRFAFINTSYNKQLKEYHDLDSSLLGHEVFTDRIALTEFLLNLSRADNHQYAIVNVIFDKKTSDSTDMALKTALLGLERSIIPYELKSGLKATQLIFETNSGFDGLELANNMFLKYHLVSGNHLSVPLKAHLDMFGGDLSRGGLFSQIDGQRIFTDFIPKLRLSPFDWDNTMLLPKYELSRLNEIATVNPEFFARLVKDRIVILGDFENSQIETLLGPISAPLLQANILLALQKGDNFFNSLMLPFLFVCMTFVSWLMFCNPDELVEGSRKARILASTKTFLGKSFVYVLITILTYLLFGVLLSVFCAALFFWLVDKLREAVIKARIRWP